MTGNDTVRAAIVGLGSWGQVLVNAVQGRSNALRFVAGHTRASAKVEGYCRELGIRLAASFDEILHGVCVFEAAVESARSGKPVLVKQ